MTTLLKRGSHGAAVEALQELLNRAGANPQLRVDGDFGTLTDRAVRMAQNTMGMVIDGEAGPQTMAALKAVLHPTSSGKAEPDKAAMNVSPDAAEPFAGDVAKAPPNADSLALLDTSRPLTEIIIHCTATPEGKDFTVSDIRAWHKARGWSDIGYHYVVYRDGRVMLGRPVGQIGSHVAGHNFGTIGISYVGGVSADGSKAKDTRTPEQRASLLWLVDQLKAKHGISKVSGHNEYAAKACPSFNVRADALGRAA